MNEEHGTIIDRIVTKDLPLSSEQLEKVKVFCEKKIKSGELVVAGEIPYILRADWLNTSLSAHERACTHVNVAPAEWRQVFEAQCEYILEVCLQGIGQEKSIASLLAWRGALAFLASCVKHGIYTCHIDANRDEHTLEVTSSMPLCADDDAMIRKGQFDFIFLPDPMLASGSSMAFMIDILRSLGIDNRKIILICVVAAPEGVFHILNRYPGVKIFVATLDGRLNQDAYIVDDGIGDAGDKYFFKLLPAYFEQFRTAFDSDQWAHLESLFDQI